jgi:hypothetical protein
MLTSFLTLQPELQRRRPKVSLRPRRCSSALESPLEVSNPHALISSFVALSFARLLFGASRCRRWATPPRSTPSGAPTPVSCLWLSPPCRSECARAFPQYPRPSQWSCPRLLRDLVVEMGGTAAIRPATLPALAVRSRAFIRDRAA